MRILPASARPLALAAGLALLVSACAGTDPVARDDAGPETRPTSSSVLPVSDPLLDVLGVDGLSGRQIVDHLDRVPGPERRSDVLASVRTSELVVADAEREISVPLSDDEFYLSIAPYLESTHDCFYHSLTTCQGELSQVPLDVRITTSTGEVLLDGAVTTYDNGFVGFWLPRGATGVIEVSYEGRSATYPFTTDDDAPTCVTTVRLV